MKRVAKQEDCAVVVGSGKPIIMEVIGENGLKIAEYVDDGKDKKPPYYCLVERAVIE